MNNSTLSTAAVLKREPPRRGKDLTGLKFSRLTVLRFHEYRRRPKGACYRTWVCQCVCGNTHIANQIDLVHGRTTSCGCRRQETLLLRTKHGLSSSTDEHRLYAAHGAMVARCHNPASSGYKNYGGRGIKVCADWHYFPNFLRDMGPTWEEGLTLDRLNVDGDYCKENCRWSDRLTQANNRRNNVYIEMDGETKSFSTWCRQFGVHPRRVRGRLDLGWTLKAALTGTRQLNQYQSDEPSAENKYAIYAFGTPEWNN